MFPRVSDNIFFWFPYVYIAPGSLEMTRKVDFERLGIRLPEFAALECCRGVVFHLPGSILMAATVTAAFRVSSDWVSDVGGSGDWYS